jgi:hypothetical protein
MSGADIAAGHGLHDRGYISENGKRSGAHPASYPMGTGGYFPGGKAAEADHSSPSSTEVKNDGVIPPLHHTPSWRGI